MLLFLPKYVLKIMKYLTRKNAYFLFIFNHLKKSYIDIEF